MNVLNNLLHISKYVVNYWGRKCYIPTSLACLACGENNSGNLPYLSPFKGELEEVGLPVK